MHKSLIVLNHHMLYSIEQILVKICCGMFLWKKLKFHNNFYFKVMIDRLLRFSCSLLFVYPIFLTVKHQRMNTKDEEEVSEDVNNVATNLYCQSCQIEFTLYYDKFGPLHKLFKNKE